MIIKNCKVLSRNEHRSVVDVEGVGLCQLPLFIEGETTDIQMNGKVPSVFIGVMEEPKIYQETETKRERVKFFGKQNIELGVIVEEEKM